MADVTLNRIRSIYGEVLGLADHLPSHAVNVTTVELYNSAIDRLNGVADDDFNRFKVLPGEGLSMNGRLHSTSTVRPKMTSLLSTLEYTYGFSKTQRGELQQAPTIVTIHNNNQVNITVTPIQQILDRVSDEDLRADIEELRDIIEGSKDIEKASGVLSKIQEKSWDVFIALLPVVLQTLGNLSTQQ